MADTPPPETVALARRLYLERVLVRAILAEAGIKLGTFYRCLDGDFPDGSGIEPAAVPRRRAGVRVRHRMGSRAALVARIWRTAERQVEEIDERLEAAGLELAEREGNARALATLVKTLRELSAIDEAQKPRGKHSQNEEHDDDPPPRDIDEFRRELARRIDAVVERRRRDAGGAGRSW